MENNSSPQKQVASSPAARPSDSSRRRADLGPPPASDLAARADFHLRRLVGNRPAANYSESLLQMEVSRNAAGLDLSFELQADLFAGGNAANVGSGGMRPSASVTAQALRTPLVQDVLRYQRHHGQALQANVRQLNRLQSGRQNVLVPVLFADESACVDHVLAWRQHQEWACLACRGTRRFWIADRRGFECACGRQYSVLEGTVFARSHVPLLTWFRTITSVVVHPAVTAREIAAHVATTRMQTLRELLQRVRATLATADGNDRLAGVPQLVDDHLHQVLPPNSGLEPPLENPKQLIFKGLEQDG